MVEYDTYVLDSILCKCLEKTASIVVLYRVVDSAGSLLKWIVKMEMALLKRIPLDHC